jgi:hypothetical protein
MQQRLYILENCLATYSRNKIKFAFKNLREIDYKLTRADYEEFGSIPEDFNIENHIENAIEGTRKFILNEKVEDIPTSKIHLKIFRVCEFIFNLFTILICLYIVFNVFNRL